MKFFRKTIYFRLGRLTLGSAPNLLLFLYFFHFDCLSYADQWLLVSLLVTAKTVFNSWSNAAYYNNWFDAFPNGRVSCYLSGDRGLVCLLAGGDRAEWEGYWLCLMHSLLAWWLRMNEWMNECRSLTASGCCGRMGRVGDRRPGAVCQSAGHRRHNLSLSLMSGHGFHTHVPV